MLAEQRGGGQTETSQSEERVLTLSDVTDPQAVLKAVAEYRQLGRKAFMAKYKK